MGIKTKSVEPLFLLRNVCLIIDHTGFEVRKFDDRLYIQLENFLKNDLVKVMQNKKITIRSSFKGLRKIDNNVSINGGEIKVDFYENAYEVNWLSAKGINKLYHQALTQSEIEAIVSDLGNWLHNNIEEFIENNKRKSCNHCALTGNLSQSVVISQISS